MEAARAILQANGRAGRPVCRSLFGRPNRESVRMAYKAAISDTLEEARKKWNFDFINEVPLEGDYKWEKVGSLNTAIPDIAQASNTNMLQEEHTVTTGCKRKQTLITDFFSKKRHSSPLHSLSPCNPLTHSQILQRVLPQDKDENGFFPY